MAYAELLSPARVACADGVASAAAALDAAALLLASGSPDRARALAGALHQREALCSTAIGRGVAIPHARMPARWPASAAFLRLVPPVAFVAPDGIPVDLVFAMAVPEDYSGRHLQVLSELAGRFADAQFRGRLRTAADAAELHALLVAA